MTLITSPPAAITASATYAPTRREGPRDDPHQADRATALDARPMPRSADARPAASASALRRVGPGFDPQKTHRFVSSKGLILPDRCETPHARVDQAATASCGLVSSATSVPPSTASPESDG